MLLPALLAIGRANLDLTGTWKQSSNQTGASAPLPLLTPGFIECVDRGVSDLSCTTSWTDSAGATIIVAGNRWSTADGGATTTSRVWAPNVYIGLQWAVGAAAPAAHNRRGADFINVTVIRDMVSAQRKFPATVQIDIIALDANRVAFTWSCALPHLDLRVEYTKQPASFSIDAPSTTIAALIARQTRPQPPAVTTIAPPPSPRWSSTSDPLHDKRTSYEVTLCTSSTADLLSDACFQRNAFAIALQGLLNRPDETKTSEVPPPLYLIYPPTWAYSYTPTVRDFFRDSHNITFASLGSTNLATAPFASTTFGRSLHSLGPLAALVKSRVKGYVKWDTTTRESLVVAFTAAGVEDAMVVPSGGEMEAFARDVLGLPLLVDLSTRFRGETPAAIYTYARKQWWSSCSRAYIMWMGGTCGSAAAPSMEPGIADWGVSQRAFFLDTNTTVNTAADSEYNVGSALVEALDPTHTASPPPMVMGWHSYCKDEEHTFTTLASKWGARVHGLNSSPNLSYANRIKLPKGYVCESYI